MGLPYTIVGDHARLSVRLTPSGGRDCFDGTEPDADGMAWLKARVSSPPEDGKANKALIAMLSKALKRPKSDITFISGETARKKFLRIVGDPEDLDVRLAALAGSTPGKR